MTEQHSRHVSRAVLVALMLISPAFAQQAATPQRPVEPPSDETAIPAKKRLEIEILIQSQPNYRIKAQEWGRAFQQLGLAPKFREPAAGEATIVEDLDRGGKITVHVVGGMAPDGSIRIRDQKFTIADVESLALLLDELELYGAAGPPKTNPKWGLTDDQFQEVTKLLMEPADSPVTLESCVVTVESIGLPDGMRLSFTDTAREKALGRKPVAAPESLDLTGMSKGTAMAIVLAQYGLGFRPQHTGPNRYQIEIDNGDESSNLWPIGWKSQESAAVVLPAWLKSISFELDEIEVGALAEAISDKLDIPLFRSSHELAAKGLNLDVLTYSRRKERVSPSRMLTAVGDKLKLGFDLRVDEHGKLFLWVTTKDQSLAFRQRFAHVNQSPKSP